MTTQRGRRATRRAAHDPDYAYGSEREIPSSQNTDTVVSEQNDSDSSYHENTPPPANASEENVCGDREEVAAAEGEQSSSEENDTDQSPSARWLRKWKRLDPGLCCVCLDEDATKDNVLVYCDGKECDVVVHQECYGITTLPKKEDPWYCDRCLALPSDAVRCVLCPNKNGAFRKIRASDEAGEPMVWVHILCAFWMPGMHIGSAADLRDIQVVNVDPKNWGKKCHVCNSEDGAAIHCDAGQCKNWVHATCAVAYGLTEYVDEENISDPYFIYCKQHGPNDHPRQNKIEKWIRMRDDFLADESSKRSEERNIQLHGEDPGQNVREIFEDAYAGYTSRREVRITDARRRIVQKASKHNGLIDAKEKAEKNVRDFRAKIPTVKVENATLKNYLEKTNEAILSFIPHMQNVQIKIHDEDSTVETLMEAMTGKTNIRWSKEIRKIAKSIKVKQLNTNEVRSLNIKSVVSALAKAAKEEKGKARQRGRRGIKGRGRPKTPNKGKEKVTTNKEETSEGDDCDEQQTPKRATRSRVSNAKGKEKFTEDEDDTQKDALSTDDSNNSRSRSQPRRVPRLRIVSRDSQHTAENAIESSTSKRKRTVPPTKSQSPDISTTEAQKKRKRSQEDLSRTSSSTSQANTESSSSSSAKKNTKRGKRKRAEDASSSEDTNNVDEQTRTSMPADEITHSIPPVKRQYRRTRKLSASKGKKADEQTSTGTSNDQTSAPVKTEQASETIQDSSSTTSAKTKRPNKKAKKTKSNETAGDVTNANDATSKSSKRTSAKSKSKTTAEPKTPTKTAKLRRIAPKGEITSVLNTEEKGECSTFPVVLNVSKKNDAINTPENNDHIKSVEHTPNDILTTTSPHDDISHVGTATLDQSSHQDNVNKVESNEEGFSNTRSGGSIGISILLNPIEDTPSSTSTIYETSAHYLYEAVNASATNQNYFGNREGLYRASSTPGNIVPVQNTGYSNITTPPLQQSYFVTESGSNQTSFRPLTTHAEVNESGTSTFSSSYTAVSQGVPYPNPYTLNQGSAATYASSFGPVNRNIFAANSYNQSSPTTFLSPYSSINENRTSTNTFTNVADNRPSISAINTSLALNIAATTNYAETPEAKASFVVLNEVIKDEAREIRPEYSQIRSQIPDNPAIKFYSGATSGQVYNNTNSPSGEIITPYQINTSKSTIAQDDSTIVETPSKKENEVQNSETVHVQYEYVNEESITQIQDIDTINNDELTPAQNTVTKPKKKRGPYSGIKKKAGRKPKVKLTEEESIQSRAPIPQPTCTICKLVIPPANDQPSATYITPQRARESMLLKGRDKVNRMVRCGYCSKWYHLGCMVPPRRTMPTGGYVWRCAECDHPSSASTSESPAEAGEAPSVPKIPTKKWNLRSATR